MGEVGAFMRSYQRKKHPGRDPNDRGYSREVERLVKNMDPADLDELLHGDGDVEPGRQDDRST
jgi:hypothetical protein